MEVHPVNKQTKSNVEIFFIMLRTPFVVYSVPQIISILAPNVKGGNHELFLAYYSLSYDMVERCVI